MLLVNCVCYSCDRVVDVNLCTHDANKIMKLFDLVGYIYITQGTKLQDTDC